MKKTKKIRIIILVAILVVITLVLTGIVKETVSFAYNKSFNCVKNISKSNFILQSVQSDPKTNKMNLTILNVQSYPTLNSNWTVKFNTTGIANLTITTPVNTSWSLNGTETDLKFLDLKCGNKTVPYKWIKNENASSVFVENWYCNKESQEISKVLTAKKHELRFGFNFLTTIAKNTVEGLDVIIDSFTTENNISSRENLTINTSAGKVNLNGFHCGDSVNFTYKSSSVTYGTILHNTRCWMDRNLGALQVATFYNDSDAHGDLFQWGRLDDGHQDRNSGTTTTTSSLDNPGHSNFIMDSDGPYDWRNPQNNNLWQGINGINNPCPFSWRIPNSTEWETERISWSQNGINGAFDSPLKLPTAGKRIVANGIVFFVGDRAYYWSSDPYFHFWWQTEALFFYDDSAYIITDQRAPGFSVRCIKDIDVGNYYSSGILVSKNLLESKSISQINTFGANVSIPTGTMLKVRFSNDLGVTWYNSSGVLNGWDTLADGGNIIDLSSLDWASVQLNYSLKLESDVYYSKTPVVNSINLTYTSNSCTPPVSGDWIINCNDNCSKTSENIILDGNLVIFGSNGILNLDSTNISATNFLFNATNCKVAFKQPFKFSLFVGGN